MEDGLVILLSRNFLTFEYYISTSTCLSYLYSCVVTYTCKVECLDACNLQFRDHSKTVLVPNRLDVGHMQSNRGEGGKNSFDINFLY